MLVVKKLSANAGDIESWVWSPSWEDPLEESITTHSSILACEIPWTEEPGGLQSIGLQRVGRNWSNLAHTIENTKTEKREREKISFSGILSRNTFCLFPGLHIWNGVQWILNYHLHGRSPNRAVGFGKFENEGVVFWQVFQFPRSLGWFFITAPSGQLPLSNQRLRGHYPKEKNWDLENEQKGMC